HVSTTEKDSKKNSNINLVIIEQSKMNSCTISSIILMVGLMFVFEMPMVTMIPCPVDPCEPNPCQNGGSCVSYDDATFKCYCLSPFGGKQCQTKKLVATCC
ncbi:unnamed protein product, partial [Owenia fusiformis]